jgi:hypothetical protein
MAIDGALEVFVCDEDPRMLLSTMNIVYPGTTLIKQRK